MHMIITNGFVLLSVSFLFIS